MKDFKDHPVFASDNHLLKPIVIGGNPSGACNFARRTDASNDMNYQGLTTGPASAIDRMKLAEALYRARRNRDELFDSGLFANPAWDLLLYLYIGSQQGQKISVVDACHASGVPEPTALRYLKSLVERGYADSSCHHHEGGATHVDISPLGLQLMGQWLDGFGGEGSK